MSNEQVFNHITNKNDTFPNDVSLVQQSFGKTELASTSNDNSFVQNTFTKNDTNNTTNPRYPSYSTYNNAISTTNQDSSSYPSSSTVQSSYNGPVNNTGHGNKSASGSHVEVNTTQVLTKKRLQDLVKEIDPCEQLDEDLEDLLLELVNEYVDDAINASCLLAKHRNANTVEVRDMQLCLARIWNTWVPGFGMEELRPYKKPPIAEAHKQRLSLIKKNIKKY